MRKLLQAALLPSDIVLKGIEVARECTHCLRYALKIPKAQVKGHLATIFNEIVQHDLFFLWDKTFMLLIDEAIRWKTGSEIADKTSPTLLKAIIFLWIRLFGPMRNLLTDQEGGLVSIEADAFFERYSVTRILVGQGAYGAKGLIERHVGLTKHSMLIIKEEVKKDGLQIEDNDICQEACMAQNLSLDYGGATPQQALTGQQGSWWNIDTESIVATSDALIERPDYFESQMRLRLLAKQAIQTSIIQSRIAQAVRMKAHTHPSTLLIPGRQHCRFLEKT